MILNFILLEISRVVQVFPDPVGTPLTRTETFYHEYEAIFKLTFSGKTHFVLVFAAKFTQYVGVSALYHF